MGFLTGLFGSNTSSSPASQITQIPENPDVAAARSLLYKIAAQGAPALQAEGKLAPTPEIPKQPVVGLTDWEKYAQDLLGKYAGRQEPESSRLARETATNVLKEPTDITQLPEYQAVLADTYAKGNQLINRLGRSLQLSGNMSTTSGRDVLGRAATDVQQSLVSSLAPYAAQERANRLNMISLANQLGQQYENMPLETISALRNFDLTRTLAEQEAMSGYNQQLAQLNYPYQTSVPLLTSVLAGQQPGVMIGGQGAQGPSMFSQLLPLLGPLLGGLMGGMGGGSSGGMFGLGAGTTPAGFLGSPTSTGVPMGEALGNMWLGF